MKIIFWGTPDFAVPSLDILLNSEHEIVAIVTGQDKPTGRGQKLKSTPVKLLAKKHRIPVLTPDNFVDTGFISQLRKLEADLFIVVAFRILPEVIFTMPPLGTINVHASLLPKYRGAAPINWAVINGEKETGITTFFIEKRVDTGEWILQKKIEIGEAETAGELHDRLSLLGAEALLETINLINQKKAVRVLQSGEITKAPKLTNELCRIDWTKDAVSIFNLVRGLSPYPRAFSYLNDNEIKILRTEIASTESDESINSGDIIAVDGEKLYVATGRGTIAITELQPANKRQMTTAEYLRGHAVEVGEKFI